MKNKKQKSILAITHLHLIGVALLLLVPAALAFPHLNKQKGHTVTSVPSASESLGNPNHDSAPENTSQSNNPAPQPNPIPPPTPAPAPAQAPAPTPTPAPAPKQSTPPPVPPPPPSPPASDIASESQCPGQSSIAATTTVLVCMTTIARQAHGLGAVSGNNSLMAAAASKAQDIKDCEFSHTACGRTFNYWFGVHGYTIGCQAENIAMGQQSPGEVFVAWMNSPGHRANILTGSYDDIGVATLGSSNGPIWVMHLGGC